MCAGSAALVGCGIVPFALGNDAGGSIRVPASCCGAVGLFPTHSRVPSQAGAKHYKTTVMSDGPIAGTAADAALVYAVMAARPSGSDSGARATVFCSRSVRLGLRFRSEGLLNRCADMGFSAKSQ